MGVTSFGRAILWMAMKQAESLQSLMMAKASAEFVEKVEERRYNASEILWKPSYLEP